MMTFELNGNPASSVRAVFFLTEPGSTVALHNGGTNCRLNAHIGLLNLEESYIEVGGERRGWSTKEAFAFDDATDHTIVTPAIKEGEKERGPRVVFAVGITHPDIVAGPMKAFQPALKQLPARAAKSVEDLTDVVEHEMQDAWRAGMEKNRSQKSHVEL